MNHDAAANQPQPKPGVALIRQTANNGRMVTTLKVSRCLAAGFLLFVVAHQAVAQDSDSTVFWKRINEKGLY